MKNFCRRVAWYVFDYETPKLVTIRSFRVGIANRLVQTLILAYVIGYVIVYKKGYQDFDVAESAVTAKIKGVSSSLNRSDLPPVYRRIWDAGDYHIPSQENNAFFILTNAILSEGQRMGVCPEDPNVHGAFCNETIPCTPDKVYGNGVQNGTCHIGKNGTNTCFIHSWCPVQLDELETPLLTRPLVENAGNFTVLMKNFISFPKFGARRRNIVDTINNHSYLAKPCLYHSVTDPLCPIFKVGDILGYANTDLKSLAINGGVIGIRINWDCNLDFNIKHCLPKYEFRRLDNPGVKVSKGWNFRTAEHYTVNGIAERSLTKAYGILFVVTVDGRAGQFSAVPLFLNVGSGLALLTLATVIGDVVLLYLHKRRQYFHEKKYLNLVDEDFARFTDADEDHSALQE